MAWHVRTHWLSVSLITVVVGRMIASKEGHMYVRMSENYYLLTTFPYSRIETSLCNDIHCLTIDKVYDITDDSIVVTF